MKIILFGAGAWGTALAVNAASQPPGTPARSVQLWARNPAHAAALAAERQNTRYLPGLPLPDALQVHAGALVRAAAQANGQDLIVIATPMAALRESLAALQGCPASVAWLCKGFEAPRAAVGRLAQAAHGAHPDHTGHAGHAAQHPFATKSEANNPANTCRSPEFPQAAGLLGHEILAAVAPQLRAGVLSGPSFAQEVARGQPTALVAASAHARVRDALVVAFHSPSLRVYANDDVPGVEVGGAVKNVLAIATGLCDGLGLGLNARAALITRGLAEMTRLGVALGARAETFMGLSGLGDLVLTATGDLSRNRQVGLLLAKGRTLDEAVNSLGHVAEGVYSARTVLARARALGVDMPITACVVALMDGQLQPAAAVAALMGREAREEMPGG